MSEDRPVPYAAGGDGQGCRHRRPHRPAGWAGWAGWAGVGGMGMPSGNGLAATVNGYTLTLNTVPMAGKTMPLTFTISSGGRPVTSFDPDQTKLMHLYQIREDLTGFHHLQPTLNSAGTWSITPRPLTPGRYRIYTKFLPHAGASVDALITSRPNISLPAPPPRTPQCRRPAPPPRSTATPSP